MLIQLPFWLWFERRFGMYGALIAYVIMLCWVVTPILLVILYRKSRALERYILEMRERLATLSRHQQVERLKPTPEVKRPRRRR